MTEPRVAEQAKGPTALATRQDEYEQFVVTTARRVVAAMPLNVSDNDLQRARARMRVAFTMTPNASKILDCTPESVANCLVMSAITGLFPGGHNPDVDIIPRKNRHNGDRLELNWQISYRGYIRLGRRASYEVEPIIVYEGEEWEYEEGMQPRVLHKPDLKIPREWDLLRLGYVRVYPIGKRDQTKIAVLTREQIEARRKKAQSDAFWGPWPIEMSLKTMARYAGQREMFPCDDPVRYAMSMDIDQEVGDRHRRITGESAVDATASTLDAFAGASRALGSGESASIDVSGGAREQAPASTGKPPAKGAKKTKDKRAEAEAPPPGDKPKGVRREGGPDWDCLRDDQCLWLRENLQGSGMDEAALLRAVDMQDIGKLENVPVEVFQDLARALPEKKAPPNASGGDDRQGRLV